MPAIVLTTLNARYPHSAFGLRYLLANMDELEPETHLEEFTINQTAIDIVDRLLELNPKIIGFGVYIWNVDETTSVIRILKSVRPDLKIIIGGPEVSYEPESQLIVELADHVIAGEADHAFAALCRKLIADADGNALAPKLITAELPQLALVRSPYRFYSESDIANRVLYVEASRGCPFRCQFCLSALPIPVRQFDLDQFLADMQSLFDRGARQFKFVDRTFNLNMKVGRRILDFFLTRYEPGLFLHFEMIPDRLPEELRQPISAFPDGCLQFEVGIQTFNSDVAARIDRKQCYSSLSDNLTFLRNETGVHVHADLIVGLPGETLESFGHGFDQLVALAPAEIQVGLLKRLRGTPIVAHDDAFEMVYSPVAPYELLKNAHLSESDMARMRRFARFWDMYSNSGNFVESLPRLWNGKSPFQAFLEFSDWLFERMQKSYGISLSRQFELLWEYLGEEGGDHDELADIFWNDYCRGGRSDKPRFLRRYSLTPPNAHRPTDAKLPKRQQRHNEAPGLSSK